MKHCHDLMSELCDYLDGDLDGQMCRELEEHLCNCPHCSSCLSTMRVTISMCRETLPESIPDDVCGRLTAFLEERVYIEERE